MAAMLVQMTHSVQAGSRQHHQRRRFTGYQRLHELADSVPARIIRATTPFCLFRTGEYPQWPRFRIGFR
jgi:hypothetical protein